MQHLSLTLYSLWANSFYSLSVASFPLHFMLKRTTVCVHVYVRVRVSSRVALPWSYLEKASCEPLELNIQKCISKNQSSSYMHRLFLEGYTKKFITVVALGDGNRRGAMLWGGYTLHCALFNFFLSWSCNRFLKNENWAGRGGSRL